MSEKRSTRHENVQLHLLPDAPTPGVGARQAAPGLPIQGGGYQDVCTVLEFQKKPAGAEKSAPARDPRLDDLQRMGLPGVWLEVAETIGVDAFLATWRIIDADPACWHNDTILRVRLRPYRSYLRYQRNRFIESLVAQGMKPAEVQARIRQQLGEDISHRHITRLAKADRLSRA